MSEERSERGSTLYAILFIAATNIGIAYFTIPVLTGVAGFIPGCVITLIVWAFTLAIALLLAEATLGQPDGANIISISRALFGKIWTIIIGVVFFINMLSYLATYAYFIETSLDLFFYSNFNIHLSPILYGTVSTLPFFLIIFFGISFSCKTNSILIIPLFLSIFLTIYRGSPLVEAAKLSKVNWGDFFFSVPILFSAFGFAAIVPPLCSYLNRDPKKIRLAFVSATLITLAVYLLWQWFVIGAIAPGSFWLIIEEGVAPEKFLTLLQKFPYLSRLLDLALFFSVSTSLIGNGLGTVEFLCDGLKLPLKERKGWKRGLICLALILCILPFSMVPGQPFMALMQNFTSPIGEVLINGVVPVWMVVQARYVYKASAPHMLPGRHITLMILCIAIFILIYLEGIEFIRS